MKESTKTNAIVGYHKNISNNANNQHKKLPTSKNKEKMFKGMNIIKVALYMLRKKGVKSTKNLSPSFPASTNATLTNLVGSFRPLHLQSDVGGMSSPPPLLYSNSGLAEVVERPGDRFEASPAYNPKYAASSSSLSSSSGGGMSRYASAQSLYDLDDHDDDEEEESMMNDGDAYYDGLEGDEMIDAKADMFIAKFYQQMRHQP